MLPCTRVLGMKLDVNASCAVDPRMIAAWHGTLDCTRWHSPAVHQRRLTLHGCLDIPAGLGSRAVLHACTCPSRQCPDIAPRWGRGLIHRHARSEARRAVLKSNDMSAPIDPALFSPFDGKDSAQSQPQPQSQSYAPQPQQNVGHPYYLPASAPQQQQPPQQSQLPPHPPPQSSSLDPVLQQTSPHAPEGSHDEYEHDDDGDHDGLHATPGSAKDAADVKRPRACDSCRGLKVRCDQERPDVSCKRCAKAGRPW